MTAPTLASDARVWLSLHCFAYWPAGDLDRFLCRTVAPLLDRLRDEGRVADWFYIRYWEGGPHLRLRLRGTDPATAAWLRDELGRLLAEAPFTAADIDGEAYYRGLGGNAARSQADWHRHGDVREIAYVAETARYGGPDALATAEEVFCRSSEVAVRVVAATPDPRTRLAAATELTIATATALGLDRLGAARWLRAHAAGWRWNGEVAMLPTALMQERTARVLAAQAATLNGRWTRTVEAVAADPEGRRSPVTGWAAAVRDAHARLRELEPAAGAGRWLAVWASQLHMMFNRLGITPDEERSVCWLVAGTALAPAGPQPFFADGVQAADRGYHEASKYLLGGASDHAPREADGPPSLPRFPGMSPPTPLPAHEAPNATLVDVLRRRRSARGALTGPVDAADLGTLLWTAYSVSHHEQITLPDGSTYRFGHRPYPSAGAKYVARLRLIARDVAGLAPGCYHVDPVERVLWQLGDAPSDVDLVATSDWFQPGRSPYEGLDISALPAMLALYVELGRLRPRYGLRGLRFATAEAGHLAQNLSLVGAATGLSVGMIGGFYDDVVHEVVGLDGIDNIAIYLLPVGRQRR